MRQLDPLYGSNPWQNIRRVNYYQNEIRDLYGVAHHEGEEMRGQRFAFWRFIRGLEDDLTPGFMEKFEDALPHHFTPGTTTHIS